MVQIGQGTARVQVRKEDRKMPGVRGQVVDNAHPPFIVDLGVPRPSRDVDTTQGPGYGGPILPIVANGETVRGLVAQTLWDPSCSASG